MWTSEPDPASTTDAVCKIFSGSHTSAWPLAFPRYQATVYIYTVLREAFMHAPMIQPCG